MNSPYFPFLPKRIVCAALRSAAGLVVAGPRHSHAYHAAARNPADWSDNEHIVQGFIDQDGDFYDRRQAYALAVEQHQVPMREGYDPANPPILTSEDLH